MKIFIKCNCREVEITKHEHMHRDADAGCLFCGRCQTVMAVRKET